MDAELIDDFCKQKDANFTKESMIHIRSVFEDLPDEYFRELKNLEFITYDEAKKMTRKGYKIKIRKSSFAKTLFWGYIFVYRLMPIPLIRRFKSEKKILKEADQLNLGILKDRIKQLGNQ